jgi:integrase
MIVHVHQGKCNRDRDLPLTPKLLETLREYWRWMKPRTYLFPSGLRSRRADHAITDKAIWHAVRGAAKRAGIDKPVTPHTLPHLGTLHHFSELSRSKDSSPWPGPMCGSLRALVD